MKAEFWSCDKHAERYTATSMDEAVEDYLDAIEPIRWPVYLEARGYAREVIPPHELDSGVDSLLEGLLGELGERYGDPNGDPEEPTKNMLEAAIQLCAVVVEEFTVWGCEEVVCKTVRVRSWVKSNRPDWWDLVEKALR